VLCTPVDRGAGLGAGGGLLLRCPVVPIVPIVLHAEAPARVPAGCCCCGTCTVVIVTSIVLLAEAPARVPVVCCGCCCSAVGLVTPDCAPRGYPSSGADGCCCYWAVLLVALAVILVEGGIGLGADGCGFRIENAECTRSG
jgi:hypothetical protein